MMPERSGVGTAAMATPPVIDPTSDRPVYKQIADWIRAMIDDGTLSAGEQLPSESKLMRRFDTTRTTVRRAFSSLAAEGRIRTQRGVGVFVKEIVLPDAVVREPYDRLARHHYLEEGQSPLYVDAAASGLEPDAVRQDRVQLREVPAPDDVAACLQVDTGTIVFERARRMSMGDLPTQLTRSYIPLDLAVGVLREERTGPGGTQARIEDLGHTLTYFTEQLRVRMPTPEEARSLRLEAGVPVVDLVQTTHSAERPVECFVAVIAGDRYVFRYRIDAD